MYSFAKDCLIVENRHLKGRFYLLTLQAPGIGKDARPGQFLHLRVASAYPLLRRAFSIYRVLHDDEVLVLYERIGEGTTILSEKSPGEYIDSYGASGQGFSTSSLQKTAILVGGGIGIAPLLFLADCLLQKGHKDIRVLLGFRSQNDMIGVEDFQELGLDPVISTNDGSYGQAGYVTELLSQALTSQVKVFACGPLPLLYAVGEICVLRKVECEVSVHSVMGCGTGLCLGCVFPTNNGYKLTCTDGPVFNAKELI